MAASFTMASAPLLGGVVLGLAAASNLLLTGRVLGVSGAIKGLVTGDRQAWRVAFILGMMLPAPFLASLLPSSFITLPATMTLYRTLLSGLLVGLGAAIGNGCTSGHGICGMARMSLRSLAFTMTFMAAGFASVWAFGSAAAVGLSELAPGIPQVTSTELWIGSSLLAGSVGLLGLSTLIFKVLRPSQGSPPQWAQLGATALIGGMFATGLMISGMTNPAKVIGFLSILTPAWDPSLIFVMLGAVATSILPYQWVMGRFNKLPDALTSPVLCSAYAVPSNSMPVDAKLLIGGVLFGMGWGMSGLCPGPALASILAPTAGAGLWVYLAGLIAGMAAEPTVCQLLQRPKAGAPASNSAQSATGMVEGKS